MSARTVTISDRPVGEVVADSTPDLSVELRRLRSGMSLFQSLPEIAASAVLSGDMEALAREGLIALGAAVPFAYGAVLSIHGDHALTLWAGDSEGRTSVDSKRDLALDEVSPVYRRVIQRRKAGVLRNTRASQPGREFSSDASVRTLAIHPARSATGVPGLVLIGRSAGDPFLPLERTVLDVFADWLGAALHDARRLVVERAYAKLTGNTVSQATEPDLFTPLAEKVRRLTQADGVGLALFEDGRLRWRSECGLALSDAAPVSDVVWPHSPSLQRVLEAGGPAWGRASDFSLPLVLASTGTAPRSLMLVPFNRQGGLLGAVVIAYESDHAFTAEDMLKAEGVGRHAAHTARFELALETARKQVESRRLLDAFNSDLLSSMSYHDRFLTIARWLPRLVPAHSVALYRRNPETGRLSLYDRIQVSAAGRLGAALPANLDGLMEHLEGGEDVIELPPHWLRKGGRGTELPALLIPLWDGDALMAALMVFMQREQTPTPEHLAALREVAEFARLPLRNSQLFETLQDGKRDWEQTFDTITDSFALLSPDRVVRRINKALALERGAHPKDYVGLRCHDVLCERDGPCAGCPLPQAVLTQTATTGEVHNLRTGQTYSVQAFPVMNEEGKVVSVVEIARNITVSRLLQEQLIQSERLRALGEMASGVAHHFKNILATVLGQAEVLLHNSTDPNVRHSLQVISQAALDGATTVQRIQSSTRAGEERSFILANVNELVQETVESIGPMLQADAANLGVTLDVETSLGQTRSVWASPPDLREVFVNLMNNARDAMPGGGRIRIQTWNNGSEVFVSVGDTGVGMDEDTRARIFDPFFSTKGGQGAGLGLSIAYAIVRKHLGEISVESAPGRGTTITLRFPAADLGPEEPEQRQTAPVQGGWQVLVIEDNQQLCEVLARMLALDAHQVTTSTNSAEALRLLQERAFDVVFTDLNMPKVSGWEIAAAAKAQAPAPFVVIVTGMDASITEEEAAAAMADVIMPKPFTLASLRETVARLAARKAAR